MSNPKKIILTDGRIISPYSTNVIDEVCYKENKTSGEPYLFFGKEDIITHQEITSSQGPNYYSYVAFNSGFGSLKKATFKMFQTHARRLGLRDTTTPTIDIKEIPIKALIQLRNFLNKKRDPKSDIFEKNTYCNTIYEAVVAVVDPPQ